LAAYTSATLGIFRYVDNEMDVRLLASRDGLRFTPTDRATPFLAPAVPAIWDAHMVSMTSQPVEIGDEWFFYHGGTKTHHDWWMCPEENLDEPESARSQCRDARWLQARPRATAQIWLCLARWLPPAARISSSRSRSGPPATAWSSIAKMSPRRLHPG